MTLDRRQALRILGASLAIPLGALTLREVQGHAKPVRWRGEALGALSAMTLWSNNPGRARRALVRMQTEIARLDSFFSLHRPESELARLNRDARLDRPSRDLRLVLDQARVVAEASRGAFDPTIQPLWALHNRGAKPESRDMDAARSLVDYTRIDASRRAIRLGDPRMALSLNGIAQGYITDRITTLLGNEGFENAVIELGETRALGEAPNGHPYQVNLIDPHMPARIADQVTLANAALSVSGGYGHRFGDGTSHHIFDPRTGQSAMRLSQVAVIAPNAMLADALSTAIYVAGETAAHALIDRMPSTSAILTRTDGSISRI